MKSYGLDLQHSDVNSNADAIISGSTFPLSPQIGFIFFLTNEQDGKAPGSYVFDGNEWINGDISSVVAGYGLQGGGESGDVTLSLDVNVVTAIIQQNIQTSIQEQPDPIAMSLVFGS
jgi:hypothetical protein